MTAKFWVEPLENDMNVFEGGVEAVEVRNESIDFDQGFVFVDISKTGSIEG